jgi:hypothetical protein
MLKEVLKGKVMLHGVLIQVLRQNVLQIADLLADWLSHSDHVRNFPS